MKIKFSNETNRKRRTFIVVSLAITTITLIMENWTQKFIDSLVFSPKIFSGLVIICLFLSALRYSKQFLKTNLEKTGNFEGQEYLFKSILSKDYTFFKTRDIGNVLYNLTEDIYKLMPWYTYGKIQLSLEIIQLICLYVFMFNIDVGLSIVALFLVFLSLWCANLLSDKMGNNKNNQQEMNSQLNQYMINVGKSMNTIKQLNKTSFFIKRYDDYIANQYSPIVKKVVKSHTLFISQLIFSQEIIPLLMMFIGVILTILGKSSIGNAIVMMDLTIRISSSIQAIADLLPQRSFSLEIEKRLTNIMDSVEVKKTETIPIAKFEDMKIKIDGYQHEMGEKLLLANTNLQLKKGNIYVIKGTSGSGKSTLAKILSGLEQIEATAGSVQYNDCDINQFSKEEYHKHVLLVNQDITLFQGTVKQNILLGYNTSNSDLEEIIRICELQDFIKKYGVDYYIKNIGENVSGGERQRIGLARMLIRKPDILILDEVTSALDQNAAEKIAENIANYARAFSMTIIAISHKEDFEIFSDKIINIG